MLIILFTMLAFAGVYAQIATMLSENWPAVQSALRGGFEPQSTSLDKDSRRFRRA